MGFIDVDKTVRSAGMLLKPEPFSVFDREGFEYSRAYNQGVKDAILHFMRQPAADVAPRWIPVSERLPEEEADVLCCRDNQTMAIMHFNPILTTRYPKGFSVVKDAFSWRQDNVIAWMPLPKPYKEE